MSGLIKKSMWDDNGEDQKPDLNSSEAKRAKAILKELIKDESFLKLLKESLKAEIKAELITEFMQEIGELRKELDN